MVRLDLRERHRDLWPRTLFAMRGFGRVDVRYDGSRDRQTVTLARHSDGQPITVDMPDDFSSMTLQAFRAWVDAEVEKIMGPTDFPTISLKPQASSIDG